AFFLGQVSIGHGQLRLVVERPSLRHLARFGSRKLHFRVESAGHYDLEAWGISAFYEWEFSPTFSASVRAGMFNASQDYFQRNTTIYEYPDFSHSSDDTVPGFGLGLNWRVTPSVDLRLDHDRYQGIGKRFGFDAEDTNGRFDVGVTSLNLAVRFGR
ncbi:MAG: hypothetical protein WCY72_07450, partial [Lysobacteraceae bacterium]